MVPNAGVNLNGLAYSFSNEDWSTVIETNLSGTSTCAEPSSLKLVQQRADLHLLGDRRGPGAGGLSGLQGGDRRVGQTWPETEPNISTNVVVPDACRPT